MQRLLEIGFEHAGRWYLKDGLLELDITRFATQANVLYAFIVDGDIKYIGKTVTPLVTRMRGYRRPNAKQSTNVRNNKAVRELLAAGADVELFVLPDSGLMHYGRFHLSLAAGLEDSLIKEISPPWNGGRVEDPKEQLEDANRSGEEPVSVPSVSFTFILGATYYAKGFFNVGVSNSGLLGGEGEKIEIYKGDNDGVVIGYISRKANPGSLAPRVYGSVDLRNWFQANFEKGDEVAVDVLSPTSIRLRKTHPAKASSGTAAVNG
jgi:hypothetical protein